MTVALRAPPVAPTVVLVPRVARIAPLREGTALRRVLKVARIVARVPRVVLTGALRAVTVALRVLRVARIAARVPKVVLTARRREARSPRRSATCEAIAVHRKARAVRVPRVVLTARRREATAARRAPRVAPTEVRVPRVVLTREATAPRRAPKAGRIARRREAIVAHVPRVVRTGRRREAIEVRPVPTRGPTVALRAAGRALRAAASAQSFYFGRTSASCPLGKRHRWCFETPSLVF